jgi:hypothetical protein
MTLLIGKLDFPFLSGIARLFLEMPSTSLGLRILLLQRCYLIGIFFDFDVILFDDGYLLAFEHFFMEVVSTKH